MKQRYYNPNASTWIDAIKEYLGDEYIENAPTENQAGWFVFLEKFNECSIPERVAIGRQLKKLGWRKRRYGTKQIIYYVFGRANSLDQIHAENNAAQYFSNPSLI